MEKVCERHSKNEIRFAIWHVHSTGRAIVKKLWYFESH